MNLTTKEIRRIVKEELHKVLKEGIYDIEPKIVVDKQTFEQFYQLLDTMDPTFEQRFEKTVSLLGRDDASMHADFDRDKYLALEREMMEMFPEKFTDEEKDEPQDFSMEDEPDF